MFYSSDAGREGVWRVGTARNVMFFHTFEASKARKVRSEKRGGAEDRLPKTSTKFAPRFGARAISKSKSLKHRGFGALFQVEPRKNAPGCGERAVWKSKSLKHEVLGTFFLEVRSAFRAAGAGISTRCKIRGRRRSSGGLQKRWQAWWI